MKFNNANVILFLFASAKTTHVNGISLRKSHVKGSDEENTYKEGMAAVRSMKKIARSPTDRNVLNHADAGSAKLGGRNDAHTTNHGSAASASFPTSVVKDLGGSPPNDSIVLHHADAGSAKLGGRNDAHTTNHGSAASSSFAASVVKDLEGSTPNDSIVHHHADAGSAKLGGRNDAHTTDHGSATAASASFAASVVKDLGGSTPTDRNVLHHTDAGSAKLGGRNDAHTTDHGSATSSSFAASVVKDLEGSTPTDRNVLHHTDAGSAKLGGRNDAHTTDHGSAAAAAFSFAASVVKDLEGSTPNDSIVHHVDAGSAKLVNVKDIRSVHHGSTSLSTSSTSLVKDFEGSTPNDSIVHHTDAGSAKLVNVKDNRSVHHDSTILEKSSAGESSLTTEQIRKLSSDITFDNYTKDIGQARFHEIASLTGDSILIDLSLGRRTVCNNDGSVVVTAGILLATNDEGDDTFKYVVKIFGDGSNGELNPTTVHTINEEGEGSIFERDAYVEIALSGDGKTLAIANTKPNRGPDHTPAESTIKIFKLVENSWSISATVVYSNDAVGGGGYFFGALQVSLDYVGSNLAVGLPYVDAELNGNTIPNVGNVQIYDLTSDSLSTPTFDLAVNEQYSNADITTRAYIGRKVAISGDGTSFVCSAPGDNKVYWFQVGSSSTLVPFSGGQDDSDMGSSLAITYDGTIFAYGARNHDDVGAADKGIVTVQKYTDSAEVPWQRLGQVLMGERGEGINEGSYYVGDNFGYDIALSEKDAYNPNHASNIIRLLVGSPLNDVTGLGDQHYYQGQGELFQINYKDATRDTLWEQVAYDVDGQTSGEESGRSVAMSANGDTIIIGAPGYQPSSTGGYFEGIVRVYKQTEYSSVPSSIPSDIPTVSLKPSTNPSVSSEPSTQPSLSLEPSQTPSVSAQPSNVPSVSVVPSSTPSAVVDKEFQLISKFEKFGQDKDWCLTAFDDMKLHVRPCGSYDSQLWKFTSTNKLTLADRAEGEFCVRTTFRQLSLDTCGDSNDVSVINFAYKDGSILHTKNEKTWKVGFDPEKRFERVRLYRDGTLNEVLDKWDIRYSFEMSKTQSPSVSTAPSVSVAPSVSAAPSVSPLQFSTKFTHACAINSSEVQCFGNNNYGLLGNPNFTLPRIGTPITMTYSNISASPVKVVTDNESTCVLMDDGSVYCYGRNNYGQLGDGTNTDSRTAVQVKQQDGTPLTGVTDIVVGFRNYCAIYENDDKIYCWGDNSSNQLGWNNDPVTGVKMITISRYAACVVFDIDPNKVHCKGSTSWDGKSYEMDQTITKLISGYRHVCALLADHTAKCIGYNYYGQLGIGSTTSIYYSASPVVKEGTVSPLGGITDINAGYYSTCLVANRVPMCFGRNEYYTLGIANGGANVLYPTELDVAIPDDAFVVSAHVNQYNGYAVMSDNSVYSWGSSNYRGLGDGSLYDVIGNDINDGEGESARKVAFEW
ncbi:hypothetical protein CTEN210_13039 [Chaetoceros tenuissimus]|uniref:Uncharacterized protein n=1 Tax=Chaetoceros tenuissimus TaxID=426638 RepID=A0AAD3D2N8_9STRA|nr:hypothetical protein CTEN210_13039 [Chaetoceros tenuissimus]